MSLLDRAGEIKRSNEADAKKYAEIQRVAEERREEQRLLSNQRAHEFVELMTACSISPIDYVYGSLLMSSGVTSFIDMGEKIGQGWVVLPLIHSYEKSQNGWILLDDLNTYECSEVIEHQGQQYVTPYLGDTLAYRGVQLPFGDDKGLDILAQAAVRLGAV